MRPGVDHIHRGKDCGGYRGRVFAPRIDHVRLLRRRRRFHALPRIDQLASTGFAPPGSMRRGERWRCPGIDHLAARFERRFSEGEHRPRGRARDHDQRDRQPAGSTKPFHDASIIPPRPSHRILLRFRCSPLENCAVLQGIHDGFYVSEGARSAGRFGTVAGPWLWFCGPVGVTGWPGRQRRRGRQRRGGWQRGRRRARRAAAAWPVRVARRARHGCRQRRATPRFRRSPSAPGITASSRRSSSPAGAPNHRGRDLFLTPGEPQWVIGKFAYGPTDKDLEGEEVDVYLLRGCNGPWEKLGTALTTDDGEHPPEEGVDDSGGRVYFQIPPAEALGLGRHRLHLVVAGDSTSTDLYIEVVPKGTHLFVSDVDGTLTTREAEEVTALLTGSTPDSNPDSAQALRVLAAQGLSPVLPDGAAGVPGRAHARVPCEVRLPAGHRAHHHHAHRRARRCGGAFQDGRARAAN